MSESLTEAQFNRLSRTILSNPSASVRKEALLEIRKLDHTGLGDVLRQVIADDKDDEVRDLAQNLLNKHEIQEALKRGSFEKPAATIPVPEPEPTSEPDWLERDYPTEPKATTIGELLEKPSGPAWTCRFCGTKNSGGIQCVSCGAERNLEIITEEAPRKRKSQDNFPSGFDGVFLLQPTNMAYLLGQSKLVSTMGRIGLGCTALFLLPFVAIGLFVIVFAGTEWRNYYLLSNSGVITQGEYTGRSYEDDDDDGGRTYYAEYTFEVDGRLYSSSHSVDQNIYNRAGVGEGVGILYAPNDPDLSRIEGTNDISTPVFLTFFAVFWNLISWGVFLAIIIGGIRDRQLSRDGQPVRGELLGMTGRSGSKGTYSVTAEYSFLPPDEGDVIFNKQTAQRNDLRGATFPDKGTSIMVLYKNRKHFKML